MNKFIERLKNSQRSFTIWFNSLLGTLVIFMPEILSTLPTLREHVDGDIYKKMMLVAIVGNLLLRFKTTQDLADKDKP